MDETDIQLTFSQMLSDNVNNIIGVVIDYFSAFYPLIVALMISIVFLFILISRTSDKVWRINMNKANHFAANNRRMMRRINGYGKI